MSKLNWLVMFATLMALWGLSGANAGGVLVSGIGGIGDGSGTVVAPDFEVTAVHWTPKVGDPSLLSNVKLTLEKTGGPSDIIVDLYVTVFGAGNTNLGDAFVLHQGIDGTPIEVTFNLNSLNIPLADIELVRLATCFNTDNTIRVCK